MFGQSPTGQADTQFSKLDTSKCYRPLGEAIAELEREANVRFKCFDNWVKLGKISEVDARDRLERIISAWHYLTDSDEARKMLQATPNGA